MYPSWDSMKEFLTSEAGGKLSIYEVPETSLAVIRYVKGQSQMSLSHVGAFRSVIWNTVTNRPVSVTAFKSESGENVPAEDATVGSEVLVEEFVDGVMIGQFYDVTTESWRIHTRSTLDAKCCYFSKRSFADLFQEALATTYDLGIPLTDRLEKDVSYTWILQHPENRVVCPVVRPRIVLVAAHRISENGTLECVELPADFVIPRCYYRKTADALVGRMDMTPMLEMLGTTGCTTSGDVPVDLPNVFKLLTGMQGTVVHQGVVIRLSSEPFRRWKMRSKTYNGIRKLRGNTARRDFLWMDLWSSGQGQLEEYLTHYAEERDAVEAILARWKALTQTVFQTYIDAFKARTLDRKLIPAKLRPLVYGLHNHYLTALKPAKKSLDWRETVRWINNRDTAQKIFVLNWDLRQERDATRLPLEPPATSALRSIAGATEITNTHVNNEVNDSNDAKEEGEC